MQAIELLHHMNGLKSNPNEEDTVDRVIYGDPNREIEGIAVCWMPYRETIEAARQAGANVLVAHEPTFYHHWDLDTGAKDPTACHMKSPSGLAAIEDKKQLIDDLKITILRCHDLWDWHYYEKGTFSSWARFLGLDMPWHLEEKKYVCTIPEQSAMTFAKHVADRTAVLGQPMAEFYGDPDRRVTKVAVWGGPFQAFDLGADLLLAYDDNSGMRAWIGVEWAHDTGNPIVVVDHGVLEESGVASLTAYMSKTFPELCVTHLRQGCTYRPVFGKAHEDGRE